MIVQAVSLLDDLDKELNNYVMRCREWYGWHFPELGKIITDSTAYIKTIQAMGLRVNAAGCDLSDILPGDVEDKVKEAAEISMGTEISDFDILNIHQLCKQVIEITDYRAKLYEYLKARMVAVAPNLTVLVGELVGARLISHAGSLLNLAKHPASTVQILGSEKALFKALKTNHDTPKYGLIYHAQIVGGASTSNKGKASRMLAAKAALATRVDALGGDDVKPDMGMEHRAKLESRMRQLEGGYSHKISGTSKSGANFDKYENKSEVLQYKPAADSNLKRKNEDDAEATPKKVKVEDSDGAETKLEKKKKKKKKSKELQEEAPEPMDTATVETPQKKKKKKSKPN